MMTSKKFLVFILLSMIIIIGYFIKNPYKTLTYLCSDENSLLSFAFEASFFIPSKLVLKFKNKIYYPDQCSKNNNLFCEDDVMQESIIFNIDDKLLEHHWERYDSGEFVYDQTQIIKTKMQDFYTCE